MAHLESAMLWAPIEAMTQVCRNSQKLVAKDMTTIAASVKALCAIKLEAPKSDAGSSATDAAAPPAAGLEKSKLLMAKHLTSLIKDVQGLKKKLEEADRAASKQARLCSLRLSYLEQVEKLAQQSKSGPVDFERMADEEDGDATAGSIPPTAAATKPKSSRSVRNASEMDTDSAEAAAAGSLAVAASASSSVAAAAAASSSDSADSRDFTVTPQRRLDRIFADHLLRNNRPLTAARVMASHPVLPSLLDPDIFQLCRKIESSLLESQDCSRALSWCGENRSRLAKIGSTFEFDLRLQEFLSLVKQKQPVKAIEYARKFLAPAAITIVPAATAATSPAAAPAAGPTMERTMSLPDDPPAASVALSRNNSLLPPSSSDDKKESDASTAAATMMVADPARLKILQEAMNLLVFFGYDDEEPNAATEATSSSAAAAVHPWHRYRVYWSPSRFSQLVSTFRQTALRIYGLPAQSSLEYVLHIGLGALKTSSCKCNHSRRIRDHGDEQQGEAAEEPAMKEAENAAAATAAASSSSSSSSASLSSFDVAPASSCPVCTYPLSCLARSLPVAQRSHSRLVCRLSGALMDEHNPPMALPNGFVYSKAALTKMANHNGGVITCPRTKQTFAFASARMVYVL